MRITAREYARRYGVDNRAVRARLNRGTLCGSKEYDPKTGAEIWWVEIPDEPGTGRTTESGSIPVFQDHDPIAPGSYQVRDPGMFPPSFLALLREKDRRIEELAAEVGELRAREGFALMQLAEVRKQLMAASAQAITELGQVEASSYSASDQNGQGLTVQTTSTGTKAQTRAELVAEYQGASSSGALKRLWRWLTQAVY